MSTGSLERMQRRNLKGWREKRVLKKARLLQQGTLARQVGSGEVSRQRCR